MGISLGLLLAIFCDRKEQPKGHWVGVPKLDYIFPFGCKFNTVLF